MINITYYTQRVLLDLHMQDSDSCPKQCAVCTKSILTHQQHECAYCKGNAQCSACRVVCDTCHANICDECLVFFIDENPSGPQCRECALICTQCKSFPNELVECPQCGINACSGINEANCYRGVVLFAGTQPTQDNTCVTHCGQWVEYAWCRSCTDKRENHI